MKRILFIGNCGYKYRMIGGEIAKTRLVYEYLCSKNMDVKLVDIYWERKGKLSWVKRKLDLLYMARVIFSEAGKADMIFVGNQHLPKVMWLLDRKKCLNKVYVLGIGGLVDSGIIKSTVPKRIWDSLAMIMVESQEMVERLSRVGIHTARFVPNFKVIPKLDCNFARKNKEVLSLFYLGHIKRDKGIDKILEVAEMDRKRGKIRYLFYLYGIYTDEDDEIKNGVSAAENVHYMGVVDLLEERTGYDELMKYDAFLFPTRWKTEGISGSIIDALAMGKPVIASRHNLIEYMVDDGSNGLLFDKNDSRDMLRVLDTLYEHQEWIPQMGKKSKERAMNFDVSKALKFLDD